MYDDYIQLPPEDKRVPHHDYTAYREEECYSFEFIGGLSLELYLLHIYNRPLNLVRNYLVPSDCVSTILTLLLLLIIAYYIQITINNFVKLFV